MLIVGREVIDKYITRHPAARASFAAWLAIVERAAWRTGKDLLADFPRASLLSRRRAIFRIGGNKYRAAADVLFAEGVLVILRVGDHADYDRWKP